MVSVLVSFSSLTSTCTISGFKPLRFTMPFRSTDSAERGERSTRQCIYHISLHIIASHHHFRSRCTMLMIYGYWRVVRELLAESVFAFEIRLVERSERELTFMTFFWLPRPVFAREDNFLLCWTLLTVSHKMPSFCFSMWLPQTQRRLMILVFIIARRFPS